MHSYCNCSPSDISIYLALYSGLRVSNINLSSSVLESLSSSLVKTKGLADKLLTSWGFLKVPQWEGNWQQLDILCLTNCRTEIMKETQNRRTGGMTAAQKAKESRLIG